MKKIKRDQIEKAYQFYKLFKIKIKKKLNLKSRQIKELLLNF